MYEMGLVPSFLSFYVLNVLHFNIPNFALKSNPYLVPFVVENLNDIIVYSQSQEVLNPEYSVPGVAGKEAVRETVLRRKCYFLAIGSARV